MDNIDSSYIKVRCQELTEILSEERQDFYRKHTMLFQRLRLRLPREVRDELNEIESLFNEGLVDGIEMYEMGFKEGIMHKTKSPI
ncbi:putative NAD(P)/FAD-binding protein YdhS [Paenibacillus sp. PvP094]|uniref:hypothetical protein n=1 Tax=Paenibacillus sp. PvP094 TaxID=3156394 RepID=UPI00339B63C3